MAEPRVREATVTLSISRFIQQDTTGNLVVKAGNMIWLLKHSTRGHLEVAQRCFSDSSPPAVQFFGRLFASTVSILFK
jgi:hypothetical protein